VLFPRMFEQVGKVSCREWVGVGSRRPGAWDQPGTSRTRTSRRL